MEMLIKLKIKSVKKLSFLSLIFQVLVLNLKCLDHVSS